MHLRRRRQPRRRPAAAARWSIPARYGRVIAVCGVMANGSAVRRPRGPTTLEGSFGPTSAHEGGDRGLHAEHPVGAVRLPERAVRLNGEGTSSATPQVAAAVALWFEKYKSELPRDWRRVEAVRHALFTSARRSRTTASTSATASCRRSAALDVRPVLGLPQTPADRTTRSRSSASSPASAWRSRRRASRCSTSSWPSAGC